MVPYLHRLRENERRPEETCIMPLKPATLAASNLGPELCASKEARSGPRTNESRLGFATTESGVRAPQVHQISLWFRRPYTAGLGHRPALAHHPAQSPSRFP
jgi:hypothetical protein